MKIIILFFACAIIASGITLYAAWSCVGPECYIRKHLKEYKTETVYQDSDRLYAALLKTKSASLRADVWLSADQSEAASIIKNHIIRMDTLYEKAVSPYPGEVSNAISCAAEYRPKYSKETNNGRETHLFVGFANDRLAFGACEEDLITRRAAVVMYYCAKQKRLYKFELFTPIGESIEAFTQETNNIRSLSCE